MQRKLTDKQERFCQEYLIDLNKTQAAIRAGYSKKRAGEIGWQLLQKTTIQNRIAQLHSKIQNKLEITQERVVKEIARLAFLDPRKFYDENGRLKAIKDLDDDTAAALAGMEVQTSTNDENTYTTHKIKHADKKGALELLARHLGILQDNVNVNGGFEFVVKNLTEDTFKPNENTNN